MSAKHPIIAVTGSSGAGTTTTTTAFSHIFRQLGINAAFVEGDSFHHYTPCHSLKEFFLHPQSLPSLITILLEPPSR